MIDNDQSNLIDLLGSLFIARNIEESEFLINQVEHEDIGYYKIRKGHFYQRPWKTRRKTMLQSIWTDSSILSNWNALDFHWWEKFLPRSDDGFTEQPLAFSTPASCDDRDENQTFSPPHSVLSGHKK